MERDAFVASLSPLVLGMRAEFDQASWAAYFAALKDIPEAVFDAAVQSMLRDAREFFPKVGELRAACEKHRRMLLAMHPHEPCADCEHSKGWCAVLVEGVPRVQRCGCVTRHRELMASRGLLEPIAALPGEVEHENEQVFPTLDQLPELMRVRLAEVAGQKALR